MSDSHAGNGRDEVGVPPNLSGEVGVASGEELFLEGGGGCRGD